MILFTTFGSLGDLFPYLALATEMKRRGYGVAIATHPYHRERIEAAGIAYFQTGPYCNFEDPAFQKKAFHERTGSRFLLRDSLFPQIRESYESTLKASEGAELLVTQMVAFAGPMVAAKTGIPWVSTVLAPSSFFSYVDSPVFAAQLVPIREHFPAVNATINRIARFTTRSWGEPLRELREELGLGRGEDPIFEGQHSPTCVLAMFSRALAEPQPDWPRQVRVSGFVFWDEAPMAGRDAEALEEFLRAGPPPIVFTLGSSAVTDPGTFYRESLLAARQLGRRALLLGKPAMGLAGDAKDVLTLEYAPHSRVFPEACAVVHQGGVGTTARALAAGRPMLVVPFAYDQPDNAARLVRMGVARMIGRKRYNAARAARELNVLLRDEGCRRGCELAAEQVRSEDGLGTACDALEASMKGRDRRPLAI
jgi:rhamnosyltransferase subunit B